MTTLFQEDLLARYRRFRQAAPTFASEVRRNARMLVGALVFFVGLATVLWWFDLRLGAGLALGFLASTFFHASGAYIRTRDLWPMVERITDWAEVDRMVAGEPPRGNR